MLLTNTLTFLIRNIAEFFVLLLLARFYLLAAQVSFKHPLGQFVLALTNWIVLPVRRFLPPIRNYDSACLVLAFLVAVSMHVLLLTVAPWSFVFLSPFTIVAVVAAAILELVKMSLFLLFAVVIAQALMSWIAPYNPLMPVFNGLTAPFLRPLRRIIPPVGGVDITPLILILLIQLVLGVFVHELELQILQQVKIAA